MATKIYGASDDLVEVDGDVRGEYGCCGSDDAETGILLMCSDATVLEVKYGKDGDGIWEITLKQKGSLFERIDICVDAEAKPYSDEAYFKDGLKWIYACRYGEWQKVD